MKQTQEMMRRIGDAIKKELPDGIGFFTVIFPFNNGEAGGVGRGNYISTGHRPDMIKLLRETAYRLERNQDEGSLP